MLESVHILSAWPSNPQEEMTRLFRGYWTSQAIYVAAELGLADLLDAGPRTVADLAAATGTHEPTLYRVMRWLASEGVFAELEDRRFDLTPKARALQGESPVRLSVLFLARPASWLAAGGLLHTVRTGEPAFEHVHGVDFFTYNHAHPEDQALFDRLMAAQTVPVARAVARAYDFSNARSLVDVGGGLGSLAIEILSAHAHLHGTVLDQPHVCAQATKAIAGAGLGDRCQAVAGDFFAEVPTADLHVLKFVLHDWDDGDAVRILSTCRSALDRNGRVLIIESVVPAGNQPSFAKSQDMNMLINLGGRERTEGEYRDLLLAAGFRHTRSLPLAGDLHIIEAAQAS